MFGCPGYYAYSIERGSDDCFLRASRLTTSPRLIVVGAGNLVAEDDKTGRG